MTPFSVYFIEERKIGFKITAISVVKIIIYLVLTNREMCWATSTSFCCGFQAVILYTNTTCTSWSQKFNYIDGLIKLIVIMAMKIHEGALVRDMTYPSTHTHTQTHKACNYVTLLQYCLHVVSVYQTVYIYTCRQSSGSGHSATGTRRISVRPFERNQKFIISILRRENSTEGWRINFKNFDVLLTVHLCIVLVINQLDAQILVF